MLVVTIISFVRFLNPRGWRSTMQHGLLAQLWESLLVLVFEAKEHSVISWGILILLICAMTLWKHCTEATQDLYKNILNCYLSSCYLALIQIDCLFPAPHKYVKGELYVIYSIYTSSKHKLLYVKAHMIFYTFSVNKKLIIYKNFRKKSILK